MRRLSCDALRGLMLLGLTWSWSVGCDHHSQAVAPACGELVAEWSGGPLPGFTYTKAWPKETAFPLEPTTMVLPSPLMEAETAALSELFNMAASVQLPALFVNTNATPVVAES